MSGIDGIGKRGPAGPPVGEAGDVGRAGSVGEARSKEGVATYREVTGSRASSEAANVGALGGASNVTGASPLERLRAGQIDVNGYLDLKVDEATAALSGLPHAELDTIRRALRTQLATDPTLSDLVTKATGSVPSPSEE
ncbi:MAG: hypothetical protein U0174_13075 [Polyangiaceae bacterium]